jgi:hypothetical protein
MRRDLSRLSHHAIDLEIRQRYKQALADYNKEIRRCKRNSWRNFCEELIDLHAKSRIKKILCKHHTNGRGTLKKNDGTYTGSPKETLELLMNTYFPGSIKAKERATQRTQKLQTNVFMTKRHKSLIRPRLNGQFNHLNLSNQLVLIKYFQPYFRKDWISSYFTW